MRKESEANARKQTFLFIRYMLILSTGALAFLEQGADGSPLPLTILMVVAIASNMILGSSPPFSFFDAWTQAPVLIADTAMISVALLLTRASQEFFFFFFFVLIMAAKLENLTALGLGAAFIGFASFLMQASTEGWASPALMRIPFLFATGVFYGYVVLPERTGEMVPMGSRKPKVHVIANGPTMASAEAR